MKKVIVILLLIGLIFYLSPWDQSVLIALIGLRNPVLTALAKTLAFLGSWRFLVPFNLLLLVLLWKDKPYHLLIPLGTLGCWILNHLIKSVFMRARPVVEALAVENSYSFPSGHAMVSSCFILLLSHFLKEKTGRDYRVLAYLYILLMALSRMYLGVHFPSDVSVGSAIGMTTALGLLHFFGGNDDRQNNPR